MHNTPEQNRAFRITWCETNLRWLAGEPPSEENTKRKDYMVREIKRLKTEATKETP